MKARDLQYIHDKLNKICTEVGVFIASSFGKIGTSDAEVKELNSLVSIVDKTAEEMLVERCSSLIPNSTFLTEEGTINQLFSDVQWIIDPLDGTTNFLYGIPHFSISVALVLDGIISVGAVYDVMRKEAFSAYKNGGSFLNGQSIMVSDKKEPEEAVLATGFPYRRVDHRVPFVQILSFFLQRVRAIRRMGSAALDLAYVASGRFDGYYECCLNPWDVAAGILLVEEAGGTVSDFNGGKELTAIGEEIIATNTNIHDFILSGF